MFCKQAIVHQQMCNMLEGLIGLGLKGVDASRTGGLGGLGVGGPGRFDLKGLRGAPRNKTNTIAEQTTPRPMSIKPGPGEMRVND